MKKGKHILPKGQHKDFKNWQELDAWMKEHNGNHPPQGYVSQWDRGEDGKGVRIINKTR